MSKTILITGASSGFGRDMAETLHRAGHTVYASMRGLQGKNRETAEELHELGIKTVDLDVTDDVSVEVGVRTVLAEAGAVDVLVNNAGIGSSGVTEAFTTEQAKAIFDTNVIGLLRVTRAVLPSMRHQREGLIINIGSIFGRVTFPFLGIYGASKFAVEALTDSLRYEVSQFGVKVVEVQPSTYPTNFLTNIQTPARTEVTESYGAVGRIPDAMFESLTSAFEGEDAPNPHEVSEAIADLVDQSPGNRPSRTVVGASFGTDKANADVAPVQAKVVEALGLSHLERVATFGARRVATTGSQLPNNRKEHVMPTPTIVLIHGAFGDASSWRPVFDRLVADGHNVVAPPNPLRGLPYDASYLTSFIDQIEGPVILVGHSYGGAVITVAGNSDKVAGLVYVAGVAPDEGESVNDLQGRFPSLAMGPLVRPKELADGSVEVSIDPERFHDVFCADVPEADAAFMAISQRPVAASAFDDPATAAAWRTKPSWAVFGTSDYPVAPELHRFSYQRAGSTVTEVEGASHFLMRSQPDLVAGVIREAVSTSTVRVAA